MYDNRPLSVLFPGLERLGADHHARHHEQETSYTPVILDCLSQLVALESPPGRALVVGCGLEARALMTLAERGFDAIGIEPVPDTVSTARAFCGGEARVVYGSAEELPVEPGSCRFVLMESVLEHVDSGAALPERSVPGAPAGWRAVRAIPRTATRFRCGAAPASTARRS